MFAHVKKALPQRSATRDSRRHKPFNSVVVHTQESVEIVVKNQKERKKKKEKKKNSIEKRPSSHIQNHSYKISPPLCLLM